MITIKKMIFKLVLLFCIGVIIQSFTPVLTNQVALTQMDNSAMSYSSFAMYQNFSSLKYLGLVIIGMLMFFPEIKKFKKETKERGNK